MTYVENLGSYHKILLTEEISLIQKAVEKPLSDNELNILPKERKRMVRQHSEAVRNTKFRRAVLQIYNQKCAVCGLQLGIVEASHIVPVSEGGTDEVTNGIALCPNHHKTFDQGLFVITTDYKIFPVTDKIRTLKNINIDGGIERFYESLRADKQIFFPDNSNHYPNPEYLKKRMNIEGFKLTF